jgi:hypothetical protein
MNTRHSTNQRVYLADSQNFEDFEWEPAHAYASAVNCLDASRLASWLHEGTLYQSRHVLLPLTGAAAILDYLISKWVTIAQAGPAHAVTAEMAYMHSTYVGRPTVILRQNGAQVALVLFKTSKGRIDRIDICGILPRVDEATGTGKYPR